MQNTLKERQKSILDAIIQEYLKTAEPVASQEISRRLKPEISPATIRNEMLILDELGFLEQPHTSAGRIPTDRGYRFFVDNLINDFLTLEKNDQTRIEKLFDFDEKEEFLKELSRTLSNLCGTFSITGLMEDELFYESGFSEILEEPELGIVENIKTFGKLVDLISNEPQKTFKKFFPGESIFIGKENPWPEAKQYSIFVSSWRHPRGYDGFLAMVGPKRTNYQKTKSIIKALKTNERPNRRK